MSDDNILARFANEAEHDTQPLPAPWRAQFQDEQQCSIGLCGLPPIRRAFLPVCEVTR